jgi:hypothetical protein
VLDGFHLPPADIANYSGVLELIEVMTLLRTPLADPRIGGPAITEVNPDRDDARTSLHALVAGVAGAFR